MKISQQKEKPLFPDLIWSRPEVGDLKPNILIIGGSRQSLNGPISSFELFKNVAELTVVLPNFWRDTFKNHPDNIVFIQVTRRLEIHLRLIWIES